MWIWFRGLRYKDLLWFFGLSSIGCLWQGTAYAVTMVSISGTIRAVPSCVLNNNMPIYVNFGNAVGVENINGKNFKTKIIFSVSCKNMKANTVKLQIQGAAASFDSSALKTQVSDLGLVFLLDGSPISINEWFGVNYVNLPLLEVVPVRSPGRELPSGMFNGNADLLISYL